MVWEKKCTHLTKPTDGRPFSNGSEMASTLRSRSTAEDGASAIVRLCSLCFLLYYDLHKFQPAAQILGARPIPGRSSLDHLVAPDLPSVVVNLPTRCAPGRRALLFGCGSAAL